MTRTVALLRGINVGGNRKVPMRDLTAVAERLGYARVATYIQSGNVVFDAADSGRGLAAALESRFGFAIDVVTRAAEAWEALAASSPFPDAEAERPQLLHVAIGPSDAPDRLEELRARCDQERVALQSGVWWIDYAGGVGRSRLTPALLDRLAGMPMTARNWRTVQELRRLL